MDNRGFGHHRILDQQRAVRRALARERLSLEEQAAYGLLDDGVGEQEGRGHSEVAAVVASVVARLLGSGVRGPDEAGARQPL